MAILKTKLHPALAFALIVVAFVGFGWLGLDPTTSKRGAPRAMESILDNNWNTTVATTPAIDAQQATAFETATFAVG